MTELSLARVLFLGFFVVLLVAVLFLPRRYVYLGSPSQHILRDLRLWAVLLVVIHIAIYLRF